MPPQVTPQYVAEVVAEIRRIRAEFGIEKEEVEQLKSAVFPPFARLDATAIAQRTETNENRVALVCAAATKIFNEAHTWEDMHEISRLKEDQEELRGNLKRNLQLLVGYMKKVPPTFHAFSETCFGGKMGFNNPLPELSPNEQY